MVFDGVPVFYSVSEAGLAFSYICDRFSDPFENLVVKVELRSRRLNSPFPGNVLPNILDGELTGVNAIAAPS